MGEQLSSPLAGGLTLTLLHFLWQGQLIALAYSALLGTPGVRSARARYAMSLAALILMSLCPLLTFGLVYGSKVDRPPIADAVARPAAPPGNQRIIGSAAASPDTAGTAGGEVFAGSAVSGDRTGAIPSLQSAIASWQPYILLFWLAGVMLTGARMTAGLFNVVWLRFGRREIPAELAERSRALARRLRLRAARIFCSARIHEAAVVGIFEPVILLPASWLTSLPPEVLEAVIAHELAHLRRFDVWVNLFQRVVEMLLFYHPAVWWLSIRVREERELCCDELAVRATGDRGGYALALEQVGRLHVRGNLRLATAITGGRKMRLLGRIQHVLGTASRPQREPAWLVGVLAAVVSLVIIAVVGNFSGRSAAVAQEREGRPSVEKGSPAAENEAGSRRSAEGEGQRRSPEAEAGPRRSAEGEGAPRRSAEPEGSREGNDALKGFEPQTQRETALYQMILQLEREIATLRREVQSRGGARDGEVGAKRGPRDGEGPAKPGLRDGEGTRKPGLRDGEGAAKPGLRDGEGAAKPGLRDGEGPAKPGLRDGEGARRPGLRDGEGPAKSGPGDGEGVRKPGRRDGEGAAKTGPRDGG